MALGSAGSPNGLQPMLLSDSQRRRRSKLEERIIFLMVFTTIVAVVTFVMGFTCTKIYMNAAPDLGITGLVKKAVFIVFLLCNSIPMISCVIATTNLIWPQHQGDIPLIQKATLRAMGLVTLSFVSMLVALMVGVLLVLILLPWRSFFHAFSSKAHK
ncbi:hypothetical protein CARUB_v10010537mg [Capsella rubella]|uniref:PGG domain-containing protein n=1 Tax=Capsella rubella TaxID=81985 RepID=R0GKJ0_9BRAS|nr:uncharacterized protein LOC17898219 [Capsella rubella]XP_023645738.1 uncharacterized protein LOC17898219 [Capsella rubella]XP_023645739.1 uncharacterized protein LOC17898219 [Capsella rubella]XP_023645740.1 uncharacterized protein LOC17898219 [Capsella rubella]XP_023645741.1 uncharacterized protein LOC17898219 [Capsella rubella]XP_023645742.1 uncharacterized protein LOC17898219 [Capsella rubella]XP_023645743.1 uncharacterized protein LOC17898219 [Capsella rubella]XP_023645744.1 uncharacte